MNSKDEHILTALLTTNSVSEAEKVSGVSRHTIYKRLADKEFKVEYDRLRLTALDEAVSNLQRTLTKAVDVVREIMEDTSNAKQVRLNAAALILQNCRGYTEQIEILSRLEELEKLTNKSN